MWPVYAQSAVVPSALNRIGALAVRRALCVCVPAGPRPGPHPPTCTSTKTCVDPPGLGSGGQPSHPLVLLVTHRSLCRAGEEAVALSVVGVEQESSHSTRSGRRATRPRGQGNNEGGHTGSDDKEDKRRELLRGNCAGLLCRRDTATQYRRATNNAFAHVLSYTATFLVRV